MFSLHCNDKNKIDMLCVVIQKSGNLEKNKLTFLSSGQAMMPLYSVRATIQHEVKKNIMWRYQTQVI